MASLKAQLVLRVLIIFFVCWLLTTYIASMGSYGIFSSDAQRELTTSADILEQELQTTEFESFQVQLESIHNTSGGWFFYTEHFQVWQNDKLVFRSTHTAPESLPSHEGFHDQFSSTIDPENRWLALRRDLPGTNNILVIWHDTTFDIQQLELLWYVLKPMLIVLPLALLALFWVIKFTLAPLSQLQHTIRQRSPSTLSALNVDNLPVEIHLINNAINELFSRIRHLLEEQKHTLEKERRFTANAAHELLTPLAAIKTEVQLFVKEYEVEKVSFTLAVPEIIKRVDRASRTVEQLVILARFDPHQDFDGQFEAVNLSATFEDAAVSLGNHIDKKDIQFAFSCASAAIIQGLPVPLSILCHNLLDNAIKYCPLSGKINCRIYQKGPMLILSVSNTGKPIPSYLKENLFDRFVRGPGETESGSGLGLAIVQQIAQLHSATVSFSNVVFNESVTFEVSFMID